ncbi:MAG: A/G-specific adenine glycosylase [Candidatus Saccharimonadales bacterium]
MNHIDQKFQQRVWDYYHTNKRLMPWRTSHDLYSVLVSEIMLQQTQVPRVIPKFQTFMEQFPSLKSLADASLADVLIAWQGLGYNRRAKYLHEAAKQLAYAELPTTIAELKQLPGVGMNTAAAICTYVYNERVAFIETNIRTVYIHEYFSDRDSVSDKEIMEIVTRTIDATNPREWYWALMDYGSHLKTRGLGSISRSSSYSKQSTFKGSLRQARGDIVRRLTLGPVSMGELMTIDDRYPKALEGLIAEGLVEQHTDIVCLTAHTQSS